ncbi:hepatitis A virus cellular receptor 1 isoform X1 [Castor canadensis]|uniref:Hepatitis A virus cellular receptor 1 isoform X1 n=1 Tax=Castor canadensis TaxID=51338 RepID=A0AC58L9A6_CASCN
MYPPVVILSLLLLMTGAVVSLPPVRGVVGQPVTLPCTYSVTYEGGATTMCWGRGICPSSKCTDAVVWTDGYRVTFQKALRYKLKGQISRGNVSLTIEDTVEADSGPYCCRIELRGWFNDVKFNLMLNIEPASVTSVAMTTSVSTSLPPTPAHTQNHMTVATSPSPTQPTETQSTTGQETWAQPTSSSLLSCTTDGNGNMTQPSDGGLWHSNQTQLFPAQSPWMTTTQAVSMGIAVSALVLLILVVLVITKYFYARKKTQSLSLVAYNNPQIGALQSAANERCQAQDNVYIIEDNLYVMD